MAANKTVITAKERTWLRISSSIGAPGKADIPKLPIFVRTELVIIETIRRKQTPITMPIDKKRP